MTDDDLDTLLRAADPAARTPAPPAAVTELRDQILGARSRRPRRRLLAVAAAAAVALLAGAAAVLVPQQPPLHEAQAPPPRSWSPELVAMAQQAPRLLVSAPGWAVTQALDLGGDHGEMTFSNGSSNVDLRWQPEAEFEGLVKDRENTADPVGPLTIIDQPATVYRYQGSTDFIALWRSGGNSLELRGVFPTAEDFEAVATSLRAVDVDTWLSAMPASVILPDARVDAVDGMLVGLPLPPGFDRDAIPGVAGVSDRYVLGYQVSTAVACGWIEEWIDARAVGDQARTDAAVTAMGTSRDWPILNEPEAAGGYAQGIWLYADALAGKPLEAAPKATIENSYRGALGCEG